MQKMDQTHPEIHMFIGKMDDYHGDSLYLYLYLNLYLSIYLSIYPSIYLSFYLSIYIHCI